MAKPEIDAGYEIAAKLEIGEQVYDVVDGAMNGRRFMVVFRDNDNSLKLRTFESAATLKSLGDDLLLEEKMSAVPSFVQNIRSSTSVAYQHVVVAQPGDSSVKLTVVREMKAVLN